MKIWSKKNAQCSVESQVNSPCSSMLCVFGSSSSSHLSLSDLQSPAAVTQRRTSSAYKPIGTYILQKSERITVSLSQQRRQPSPTGEALQLHVWFHRQEQHGAVGATGGDTWGNKANHIRKNQRGGAGGDWRLSDFPLKQVLESSKRWWKCRNYFNQVGFVPFNILQPMTHVESPVSSRPPSVRAPTHHPCGAQACTRFRVTSCLLSAPPSCRRQPRRPSQRPSP